MILPLLLALTAHAQDVPVPTAKSSAESETMAQIRHDLFGATFVPFYQYIRFDSQSGNTQFVGYAGIGAVSGLDHPPNVDLYTLHAQRKAGRGEWVLGRQQASTLQRRQTFDGARYWWRPNGHVALDAWGGVARHFDLDDFRDGTGIGRIAMNLRGGPMLVRAGAQVEAGKDTPFIAREDLQARATLGKGVDAPVLEGLISIAEPDFTVEWGRVEVRVPVGGRVDLGLHGQHREAANPNALFGDAILATLAGGGVNEAGVSVIAYGPQWARFSGTYRLVDYTGPTAGQGLGHEIDLAYMPGRTGKSYRITPSYSFRSGPNGAYHAFYVVADDRLDDGTRVQARAAVVPFQKGHDRWRVAVDGGLEGSRDLTPGTSLRASLDAATDGTFKVDLRLGAAITVRLP